VKTLLALCLILSVAVMAGGLLILALTWSV